MQKLAVPTRSVAASARAADRPGDGAGERRFDRRSRLVLVLALLLLVAGVAQKAYRLSLPTTGWSAGDQIDTGRPVFKRNLLGEPSPLLPGDLFVALEGVSFEELGGLVLPSPEAPGGFRAGETVSFGVLRDGAPLRLEVPLYLWSFAAILQALAAGFREDYAGLLALLIAGYVFWQRPRNAAAQLLFLVFVTKLVIDVSTLIAAHSIADMLFPLAALSTALFSHMSYVLLLAPLVLHLCLSFPEPKPLLADNPWLLWLIYGLPWLSIFVTPLLGPALEEPALTNGLFMLAAIHPLLGAVALAHTFVTTTDPVRRMQVRWVAFGFGVSSLSGVVWLLGALGLLGAGFVNILVTPTELILTACLAVAVLRYRLFDVDIVINRTLVYATLTVCVVGLYALVVGGLGTLTGLVTLRSPGSIQGNIAVSLVATGLVAVLFQPLRERLQRVVNRFMYGERDEPYGLLAKLSRRIEDTLTPDEMLPAILETVTQALKLPYAAVILYRADGEEVVAERGAPSAAPEAVVFPLVHQGETFGALRLAPRRLGESFSPAELHLLKTVAQQAGVAAYTVRQTADLKRSRERLIAAREEERRRIRRDLHDGLGPTLAGLNLQAGLLKNLIGRDPAAAVAALDDLRAEMQRASSEVRELVYDLRPPSLDQLGLAGALKQLAEGLDQAGEGQTALPCISTDIPSLPSLPAATEVAVYRITQEALTNALKHAGATNIHITVKPGRELLLALRDDGRGLSADYQAGVGLRSMRERAEELGGRLQIDSADGQGTEIRAVLPLSVVA